MTTAPCALIRAEDRLQILRRILRATTELRSSEDVASIAVQAVAEHTPGVRVGYATIGLDGRLCVKSSIEPEGMPTLAGLEVDLSSAPAYLTALLAGEPVVVPDVREDPRTQPLANEMAAGSTLACLDVPLRDRDVLIGILFIDFPTPHAWTDEEIETLGDVADQVAVTLVEARLNDERRQALQELRASEERFRQIAENVREVVWMTSADKSEFLYIGEGYEELWGRPASALFEDPLDWQKAVHPDDLDRVKRTMPDQLSGSYDETYRLVLPNGEIRWLRDRAFPVRDEEGRIYRIAGLNMDITREKQSEERLVAMERNLAERRKLEALGTLSSGIAHDFNNLLAGIIGFAELARAATDQDSDVNGHLIEVLTASDRARRLIKQIQTFSNQEPSDLQAVALAPLVHEVLELNRLRWPEAVAIETALDPDLRALADPSQVHQVLMNLVTNAKLAIEGPGTLRIECHRVRLEDRSESPAGLDVGSYACLVVADTGRGIPKAILPRIFDPFFSCRDGNVGSGLGLAVVQGVAEAVGGGVTVESEFGEGATFRVYLPLCEDDLMHQADSGARDKAPQGSGRLLFVDDEPYQVRLAHHLLGRLGYELDAFSCPQSALAEFEARPYDFDVVVTDLRMPGITGLELCQAIRAIRADVPLVICSGYAEVTSEEIEALQPVSLLQKPFTQGQIARVLSRCTNASAAVTDAP